MTRDPRRASSRDQLLCGFQATLALVGVLLVRAHGAGAAAPPTIVVLTLDTTRADHLSLYGYARPTTPALAEVARRGVVVRKVITPMPMTDPAHASIFTGLHPRTHGVRMNGHEIADQTLPTLATWARSLGYRTAAFVSRAHLLPSALQLRGFEHEDGPARLQRVGGETLAAAEAWFRAHRGERLFAWVHLFDPHAPYRAPKPYRHRFSAPDDLRPALLGNEARRPPYAADDVRALTALYDGELAYADDVAGRLIVLAHELAPAGQLPLVVVAGDHGEMLAERDVSHRYAFDHGQLLFQEVLEVPLLLRWDSVLPANRVLEGPVSLVDVAPTLFELLGNAGFPTEGRSLVPEIDGREPAGTRLAFTERRRLSLGKQMRWRSWSQFSVQDRRYKLILSTPFSRTALYDLMQDPGETTDVARALPSVEATLREALEAWRAARPAPHGSSAAIAPDKAKALRALGYVE